MNVTISELIEKLQNSFPVFGFSLALSLIITAIVFLLLSFHQQNGGSTVYTHNIKRCRYFGLLIFLGFCLLLFSLSVTTEHIRYAIRLIIFSDSPVKFVLFAFLISLATGVVWTSIKESENRAKEQIDNLNENIKGRSTSLENQFKELSNEVGLKAKKIQNELNKRQNEIINIQIQLVDTLSLIELKSICYTKYFQRLNEYTARELTTHKQRLRSVHLNRLVEFFEVGIDDIRVLNGFLEEFISPDNQLLMLNDSNVNHYLERLIKYYEHKKQTEKKEDVENILKLIRLCEEIRTK
ncbi:MAG: DUF1761 domain-containing protein [Methylococcaceae bacterium]